MKDHGKSTREVLQCASPDAPDAPYLDQWLRSDSQRKAAFKKLCDAGCDRTILGNLFLLLTDRSTMKLESGAEIRLRRLDMEPGLKPLNLRGLEKIVKKAKGLIEDIEHLKRTRLVLSLRAQAAFPPRDLLSGSAIPGLVPVAFRGLLELHARAKELSHSTPDQDRILETIYQHIHTRTAQRFDAVVADVLAGPQNAAQLKQWRWRKNLRSDERGSPDLGRYEGLRRALQARDAESQESIKRKSKRKSLSRLRHPHRTSLR